MIKKKPLKVASDTVVGSPAADDNSSEDDCVDIDVVHSKREKAKRKKVIWRYSCVGVCFN